VRHAVILGGGSGTRLWPASRQARPKQLLPLAPDGSTLLGAAVRRGAAVADDVLIVTAEVQREATAALAPDAHVVGEPVGRNTAAALGLAAAMLELADPDASLVVLPADQFVADEAALAAILARALTAAEQDDVIGTIGIQPTRAETGFGYLELEPEKAKGGVIPVKRFVEKPDRATAELYLQSGRFLWNAGIFCVTAKRLLAELDAHLPATGKAVRDIAAGRVGAASVYPTLQPISIDHAVMEHADRVVTIPASVGWDDLGSWAALPALRGSDATGNTVAGLVVAVESSGNVLVTDDDTVLATYGVSDLVVVKSGNAILVIRKDQAQEVRKVVDALSAKGLARYL
jgi:mannose-1-phosphate guanylyltransferase